MKNLYLLTLLCAIINLKTAAQTVGVNEPQVKKSGLFRQLPDSLPVDVSSLNALLSLGAGSEVLIELSLGRQQPLKGTVMASSSKYNGKIHAVSIRSSQEGAVFHLTKSLLDDGSSVFRGTWMHKDYAELYVLSYNGNEYTLVKKNFRDLVME